MDALLVGTLLLSAAAAIAIVELIFLALGLRVARAPGAPKQALLLAVALVAPALLLLAASELCVPATEAGEALARAIGARRSVGMAGLVMALPLGLASGLWAGIAAGRRVHQAAERARLSATAAGHPDVGHSIAARLGSGRFPFLGLALGAMASVAIAAPALALFLAGSEQLDGLALIEGLGPAQRRIVGTLQARRAAETVELGAAAGAAAMLATAVPLGLFLHAGSSRRRNLEKALARLERDQAPRAAREAVVRALAATGRPGPLPPLLLAALLLALAALALWARGRVPPRFDEGREEVVHSGAGRLFPPAIPPPLPSAPMRILSIPDDVAIGGIQAQADRLADEAELLTEQAEALILSLLRGDRAWRVAAAQPADARPEPRRVA